MKFEFETPPAPGDIRAVCEGIQWLYMPLPFALDHVNCWLLGEPDNQVLIDTGVDNPATREHWTSIFAERGHWPQQTLITHFHPDHMGLAGWMENEGGCGQFLGSEIEVDIALLLSDADGASYSALYEKWYAQNGIPEEALALVRRNGNTYKMVAGRPPPSSRWTYLQDGQQLTLAGHYYTVLIGRGHAPDMIMLYRESDHVLIAADQVLPSISPNVSVMPRLMDTNPLKSFLDTLERLRSLPEDTLVLPSHGLPFRGLHGRLQALVEHHDMRLEQIVSACHEPRSAHDLFAVLFRRKLDPQQTSFALGESLAHLHYLQKQGRVERMDSEGLTHYVAC